MDESNVQISSLKEQLTDAQQRLSGAETASAVLQGTETDLKQQLQTLQVRLSGCTVQLLQLVTVMHMVLTAAMGNKTRQNVTLSLEQFHIS